MTKLSVSDTDLKSIVGRVQQGDKQAYALIIQRFQRQMFLYCYYLLKSQEEAEDATQDIFIKGLENIHRFVYSVSLSAWLYKIAHNHCVDLLKKKNKLYDSLVQYKTDKEQESDHRYTEVIHDLLDKLSMEERQILLLRSLEEYSYEEMASIMELKPNTIRKKYERLRKKLIELKQMGGNVYEHSYKTSG